MISRIIKKILGFIGDPSRNFKDRVFMVFTMVTDLVILLAAIGDIILGESIVEIVSLLLLVVITPIGTLISIKRDRVAIAVRIIVVLIVFVMLPIVFFFGGGIYGGGTLWIIFAFLYSGLVLSGYWKPIMLVVLTLETVILYGLGYYRPDLVTSHSREVFYIDSLISIVLVGVVCCLMVWFEEWMFYEENKRAREETKKVEELNRTRSRFFSNMSHEIRTPINSILGLNEIILRQEDASEEIKRDARNIEGAGKMLLSLINDILDISKMEAGKMDIVPLNYNIAGMISEIVNMMQERARQKNLEFKVEIDPSIPAELFGDEVRIKQILVNLLNNAVKYTQEGSVTFRIEKEDMKGDEILLLFFVIDTGMGIKQDVLPYIFDAFSRVDEEKNAAIEGTGLGLSVVKQLVELMDGRVTVSSVYTEGSTFAVALWQKITRRDPIGDINIQGYSYMGASEHFTAEFKAPDARILIVDDNEMNLEVEKKLLDGTEVTVDTANSGLEAISKTSSVRYDVIFMDHLMPQMNGIECMQHIRKQAGGLNNHTPVIVFTANADSESRDLYNRSGFDGYLVKPVSGKQLSEAVLMHLPEIKVTRTENSESTTAMSISSKNYAKKMPVLVATSTMSDLPSEIIKERQIDTIPFSVITQGRSYYDMTEANTDEVMRYISEGAVYRSAPPTVEEFERFFAEGVKKAHRIIYIAVSSEISLEYLNAKEASKSYGNIHVIDSESNSSATGMLVLLAHRMATQGRQFERIVDELEKAKKALRCSFITGDSELLKNRGDLSKAVYGVISTFGLRPIINIKNGRVTLVRLYAGELDECYNRYLDYALPRSADPDLDLAIIVYINLSENEMETIEKNVRKRFDFEHILFQKVSSVTAMNCGRGAMGVMYLKKGDQPYNLSQVLASTLDHDDDEVKESEYMEIQRPLPETYEPVKEKAWYESIPGIDPAIAIENSGSEESFKTVLKIFYDSIDSKKAEILDFYSNDDIENYTIKVHALKSSARLVGAMELGNEAEKLEMAGKERNIDYIRDHNDIFISDLEAFKENLVPIYEAENDAKEDDRFDKILIKSAYDTIHKAALEKDDKLIGMTLNEIIEYDIPEKHRQKMALIKDSFDRGNYEEIIALSDITDGSL